MLIDTHCHLNSEEYESELTSYITRAQEKGVQTFLVVGWDLESSKKALKLAHEYSFIYAIIGFHPCNINDVTENDINEFEQMLNNDKVVAVGEIGLDYHWVKDEAERNKQKEFFARQIKTANDHHLPISIHCRDAIQETYDLVKQNPPLCGGVMHCYSGSVEMMKEFIKLGFYISFAGPVTFTNAKVTKEVAKAVPLDRLLVETDCPYLSPHPFRGQQNEPANVSLVANEIADIKEITFEEVCSYATENTKRLFKI